MYFVRFRPLGVLRAERLREETKTVSGSSATSNRETTYLLPRQGLVGDSWQYSNIHNRAWQLFLVSQTWRHAPIRFCASWSAVLVRRPGKNTYIQSKEPVVVYSRSRQCASRCVDVALESFMLHMLDNTGQSRRDLSRVRLKATACLRAMHHRLCDVGGAGVAKRGKACWR